MPYSTNTELPASVKKMPEHAQDIFRAAFNSANKKEQDEATCFKIAYAAVKNKYKQDDAGDWIAKSWEKEFVITKTDTDKRLVFGWLSVSKDKDGNLIEDHQGDIIEPEELEKAAYQFMLKSRNAGDNHTRIEGIGKAVVSIVTTKDIQKALGIPDNAIPEGWFIGYYIEDNKTWDLIKSGEYTSFSIGGKGKRIPIEGR
jgi:cation transport regulator ChaB